MKSKGLSRVFSNTSSKASILQCSAFFTDQFSHPYMTTGKSMALTRRTFVGKVTSLLLNMLCQMSVYSQIHGNELILKHRVIGVVMWVASCSLTQYFLVKSFLILVNVTSGGSVAFGTLVFNRIYHSVHSAHSCQRDDLFKQTHQQINNQKSRVKSN